MKAAIIILSVLQMSLVCHNAEQTGGPRSLGEYLLFAVLVALPGVAGWYCAFCSPERRPKLDESQ
jgi:hypothetical protein